jgi:hypothetical protein
MSTGKKIQSLLSERERLVRAVQDLEADYRSGLVSKTDYELVRERYERKLREVEQGLGIEEAEASREKKREKTLPPRARRLKADFGERRKIISLNWLSLMGLIGGILAAASVGFAWVTFSGQGWTVSYSGVDVARSVGIFNIWIIAVGLAGFGGFLATLGAVFSLKSSELIEGGFLLPIGGILAFLGGGLSYLKMSEIIGFLDVYARAADVSISVGQGIYMCVFGAALALLAGLGLSAE